MQRWQTVSGSMGGCVYLSLNVFLRPEWYELTKAFSIIIIIISHYLLLLFGNLKIPPPNMKQQQQRVLIVFFLSSRGAVP